MLSRKVMTLLEMTKHPVASGNYDTFVIYLPIGVLDFYRRRTTYSVCRQFFGENKVKSFAVDARVTTYQRAAGCRWTKKLCLREIVEGDLL